MLTIVIIEAVALLFLGLLVVGLLRSHAEILRTLHEIGAGSAEAEALAHRPRPMTGRGDNDGPTGGPSHDIRGQTLNGEHLEIGLAGGPTDTLLAFLSATCYTCEPFWGELAAGVPTPNNARVIAVVQDGDNQARLRMLAGPDLLVVRSDAAWTDYDVPGSPHFVYVDGPSGRVVGEGTAATWQQVSDLLEHANGAVVDDHRDNATRIDLELLAAGIGPGHPSLYPETAEPPVDSAPPA